MVAGEKASSPGMTRPEARVCLGRSIQLCEIVAYFPRYTAAGPKTLYLQGRDFYDSDVECPIVPSDSRLPILPE